MPALIWWAASWAPTDLEKPEWSLFICKRRYFPFERWWYNILVGRTKTCIAFNAWQRSLQRNVCHREKRSNHGQATAAGAMFWSLRYVALFTYMHTCTGARIHTHTCMHTHTSVSILVNNGQKTQPKYLSFNFLPVPLPLAGYIKIRHSVNL